MVDDALEAGPPAGIAAGRGPADAGADGAGEADPPDDTCKDDNPLPAGFETEVTGGDELETGLVAEVVGMGGEIVPDPALTGFTAEADAVAAAGVDARLAVPPPVTALGEEPEPNAGVALAEDAGLAALEAETAEDVDGGGTGALASGTVDDVLLMGRDAAGWGDGGGVGRAGGGVPLPPDEDPPVGGVGEEADVGVGFWVMGAVPTARLGLDV